VPDEAMGKGAVNWVNGLLINSVAAALDLAA